MAKVQNCSLEVSKFELQSTYYVHFQTNIMGEMYEPSYPHLYEFSIIGVLLQEWLWH